MPAHAAHAPGAAVVVRTVTGGRIRWASAGVCVQDDDETLAYFQANRTPNKVTAGAAAAWPDRRARELALRSELVEGEFVLVDKMPAKAAPTLTVARYGDWFSVRFVARDEGWQPEYVNVCLPFRRSAIGFDTEDLCLDVVPASGRWRYKDAEDLGERAAAGIYDDAQVDAIRAAGAEAIDRLTRRLPPFDGSWTDWSPDPTWGAHDGLPTNWRDDLVALAYP